MAKAGYLHLFDELAAKRLIPEPVAREILAAPPSDPARKALESGLGKSRDFLSARAAHATRLDVSGFFHLGDPIRPGRLGDRS